MIPEFSRRTILKLMGVLSFCLFAYAAIQLGKYYLEYQQQEATLAEAGKLWAESLGQGSLSGEAGDNGPKDGAQDAVVSQQERAEAGEGEAKIRGAQLQEAQLQRAYQTMKQQNADYVFWMTIPDTNMDFPVVQRDNDYYLSHNFYGKANSHGAVFLDESCELEGIALLIHGHHMKDGTMFAGLKQYKDSEWRKSHTSVFLYMEEEERKYQLFAGMKVDLAGADYFAFEKMPQDEKEMLSYLAEVQIHSFWYDAPRYEEGDNLLLLSTCDYGTEDERLVLFGIQK